MKRVYVPSCKSNYDISDAEHFGELVIITEGIVDISNLTNLAKRVIDKLKTAKEDDYLVMAGAPIVNSICFAYLMSIHGRVNLLIFDARTRRYRIKTISEQEVMG